MCQYTKGKTEGPATRRNLVQPARNLCEILVSLSISKSEILKGLQDILHILGYKSEIHHHVQQTLET